MRQTCRYIFRSIARSRFVLAFFISIFLSILVVPFVPAQPRVKELPMLVTVNDLKKEPGQYDGHRIVVTGRVQSIEIQRGRRGSEYVMMVLEGESTSANGPGQTIQVISLSPPTVREGYSALVQGTYHVEGKQAGRPFENFIDAEVILKDKL